MVGKAIMGWASVFGIALSLLLCVSVDAAVLFSENFDSATGVADTALADAYHAGGTDRNIGVTSPGANGTGKCLSWLRQDSGWYYVRGTQFVHSNTGRFVVSFWSNFGATSTYMWAFSLVDQTYSLPFVNLFEGYTQTPNTYWGELRASNPDGTFRNLCPLKTGWRQVKIIVDFNRKIYDVYYDDMTVPVAVELPVMNSSTVSSSPFMPALNGVSSGGEQSFRLDDLKIEDVAANNTPVPPNTGSWALSSSVSGISANLAKYNGTLTGIWKSGVRLLTSTNDIYYLQGTSVSTYGRESQDVVTSTTGTTALRTQICTNPALPGVSITKTYSFDSQGRLLKKVAFSSSSVEGFVTHISRSKLDSDFMRYSYPAGYRFASSMNIGDLSSLKNTPYLCFTDYSLGMALYRWKVNDRYVLPGMVNANPDGYEVSSLCDYMKPGFAPSSQVCFDVFAGDFTNYERSLNSTPEFKALYSQPRPEWMDSMVGDVMCAATPSSNAFSAAAEPLSTTATIWFLNPPWGNWWADSDPPLSSHYDVYGIAPSLRAIAPDSKISAYTNTLFDKNSDVYLQHPEYGVTDRDGSIVDSGVPSDAGGVPAYLLQILNPTARQYWLDMHADKMDRWGFDFFYMDGPGAYHETPDWALKRVTQCYDWFDFYRDLKDRLQAVKPDMAFFTNGFQPYSDIGYIEWRDEQWQILSGKTSADWRWLAQNILCFKMREAPGYIVVPTYGGPNAQPAISSYNIMYGWCGHGVDIPYVPWMLAALEYRGTQIVTDAVADPWWRSDTSEVESYAFTKGDNVIVNMMNHSTATSATVNIDRQKLGLVTGQTYLMTTLCMRDPSAATVPTSAFAVSSQALYTVTTDTITLTVPVTAYLVTSVIISKALATVESNGAKTSQSGITESYGVNLKLQALNNGVYVYSISSKYAGATIFFPYATVIDTAGNANLSSATATKNALPGRRLIVNAAGDYVISVYPYSFDHDIPGLGVLQAPATTAASPFTVSYNGVIDTGGSGLKSVKLYYKYGQDGLWRASGSTTTTSSGSFSFLPSSGEGDYYFALRTEDNAGNKSPIPSGVSDCSTLYSLQHSISGNINLLDFQGAKTAVPVLVTITAGSNVVSTQTITLDATGNYTIPNLSVGSYTVTFKASHWLAKAVSVTVGSTDVTGLNASLTNGDCDGDNEITSTDLSILGLALGSIPGDSNWDPNADLDGDNEITSTDLSILGISLGAVGD